MTHKKLSLNYLDMNIVYIMIKKNDLMIRKYPIYWRLSGQFLLFVGYWKFHAENGTHAFIRSITAHSWCAVALNKKINKI